MTGNPFPVTPPWTGTIFPRRSGLFIWGVDDHYTRSIPHEQSAHTRRCSTYIMRAPGQPARANVKGKHDGKTD